MTADSFIEIAYPKEGNYAKLYSKYDGDPSKLLPFLAECFAGIDAEFARRRTNYELLASKVIAEVIRKHSQCYLVSQCRKSEGGLARYYYKITPTGVHFYNKKLHINDVFMVEVLDTEKGTIIYNGKLSEIVSSMTDA